MTTNSKVEARGFTREQNAESGSMKRNVWLKSVVTCVALGSLVVGCGGTSKGSTTPEKAAKDAQGNVVTSGSGAAVSKEAADQWASAMAEFQAAEKAGWNEGNCESVSDAFDDAASEQGGKFAEAVYMSGLALDRCGKTSAAQQKYAEALAINPKQCGARVGQGIKAFKEGNSSQAYSAFERAVRDDARCTEGYVNLAMMQMARDGAKSEEALNNLRRALAIDAQYAPAFNQMAQLFLGRAKDNEKMLDLAAVVCRQAQLIDPDYAPIYNTWGLINVRKGNVFDALRMFERAFQLDPTMFEAYMNFGEITLSFRGYEDAKTAFSKAVELMPKNYDAHVGLGAALRGLGDATGAKAQYEEAQKLDGARPDAFFNLGLLYQDYMSGSVQDLKQALTYFDQFVSRAQGKPDLKSTVEDVERRCQTDEAKKKRKSSKSCRPGRRQNIQLAIEAMAAMAQMEKQAGSQ